MVEPQTKTALALSLGPTPAFWSSDDDCHRRGPKLSLTTAPFGLFTRVLNFINFQYGQHEPLRCQGEHLLELGGMHLKLINHRVRLCSSLAAPKVSVA